MWKWITLLAFLGWCFISWNWYTCGIKSVCDRIATDEPTDGQSASADYGPITFNWKGNDPILGNGWDNLKDRLTSLMGKDKTLQITGNFYPNEVSGEDIQLGLDRGTTTKALLAGVTDPSRISVTHDRYGIGPEGMDDPFNALKFDFLNPDGSLYASLSGDLGKLLSRLKGFDIPLKFDFSSDKPIIDASWPEFKSELMANLPEGHTLKLVGRYMNGETYEGSLEQLGNARANAVKALFDGDIDASLLSTEARGAIGSPGKEGSWQAILFKILDPDGNTVAKWGIPGISLKDPAVINEKDANADEVAEKKEDDKPDKTKIVELDDRVLIYFPFNSSTKEKNATIDSYLKKVAQNLKEGGKISLTGHTDYIGPHNTNWTLGERRAKSIRDILISEGVTRNQITVDTKGETKPIATNDTDEGRRKNRRVELVLN